MKTIKLILRQDIEKLGEAGEVVAVRPGYARNYLLPQGLAYAATASNMRQLEEERKRSDARTKRDYLESKRRLWRDLQKVPELLGPHPLSG